MGSACSAESFRGVALEVLQTWAVYQCSTLLTMRVLAELPLRLRFSQVYRSSLLWTLPAPAKFGVLYCVYCQNCQQFGR